MATAGPAQCRLEGCCALVDRLAHEGTLRPGLDNDVSADLLLTLTNTAASILQRR